MSGIISVNVMRYGGPYSGKGKVVVKVHTDGMEFSANGDSLTVFLGEDLPEKKVHVEQPRSFGHDDDDRLNEIHDLARRYAELYTARPDGRPERKEIAARVARMTTVQVAFFCQQATSYVPGDDKTYLLTALTSQIRSALEEGK